MVLTARAPTRIDLAGGTIDLWPIYLLVNQAATVNIAIDLYTEVVIEQSSDLLWHVNELNSGTLISAASPTELAELTGSEIAGRLLEYFAPEHPLTLKTKSNAPPQSGLGGSSSLGISIAGALNILTGSKLSSSELIKLVQSIEVEVLRTITGSQDHYPSVYGGAMCLWWDKLSHRREKISIDGRAFQSRFLLAYSQQPHRSGATNWEVVKRFLEGDKKTVEALEKTGETAALVRDALIESDFDRLAKLIWEDWLARRNMAPEVSSPELEEIIDVALQAGALAARVCGAGGGGCVLVACPEGKRGSVGNAITEAGGSILHYNVASHGLEIASSNDWEQQTDWD